ncbi:DUF6053 domain-containing protein [Lysobacter sp. CA199]|uniref:DUF6053 domain-containing protein n=1 Tax=Lysobacter sp. CA199 TaxID=3455608 RepID=UPI003F8D8037
MREGLQPRRFSSRSPGPTDFFHAHPATWTKSVGAEAPPTTAGFPRALSPAAAAPYGPGRSGHGSAQAGILINPSSHRTRCG